MRNSIISEKGVDSSLAVHLFDTMDSWDTAFLLSGDADFVPAVASLRRRGKIIVGVGFPDASEALVRECYHYVNIQDVFLNEDVLAYTLYRKEGVVHKWLSDEVKHDVRFGEPEKIELRVRLVTEEHSYTSRLLPTPRRYIFLDYSGSIDLLMRHQMMTGLMGKYAQRIRIGRGPNNVATGYTIRDFTAFAFEAIKRRASNNLSSIIGLTNTLEDGYQVTYRRNARAGTYEPTIKETSTPNETV